MVVQSSIADVGLLIRHRRLELDMTQSDLAERVGVSRSSITNLESGKESMGLPKLQAIANMLGCRLAVQLYTGTQQVGGSKRMRQQLMDLRDANEKLRRKVSKARQALR